MSGGEKYRRSREGLVWGMFDGHSKDVNFDPEHPRKPGCGLSRNLV